jgi:hypothetical protein
VLNKTVLSPQWKTSKIHETACNKRPKIEHPTTSHLGGSSVFERPHQKVVEADFDVKVLGKGEIDGEARPGQQDVGSGVRKTSKQHLQQKQIVIS